MGKILGYIYQYFCKLDKALFAAVIILSVFSVVLLYSIVANDAATIEVSSSLYRNQAVAICAGAVIALIISAADYHHLIKLWVLYAPLSIILVLLTFTSFGIEVESTGDRAWLDFGFGTIQPSEVLKTAFVTTFALHLSKVGDRINEFKHVILLCLHGAVPVVLIFLQGDDGTACVFLLIFAIMMYSAGISLKYIIPCLIAVPVGVYFLWNYFMQPYQKMRFLVLFDEDLDPLGVGYQQRMSKIALGSGQVFGKGLFDGSYIALPEVSNDFIFTYVGQVCGFIGCLVVVVLLTFVAMKILADSRIAKDLLGKYLCVGMFSIIAVHSVLNLGMVFGVMPVIGVPLPFLSQGGTSVLSLYIGIGLVMSTYSHSEKKYRVFYDAS
ncbi:MAG: rod shape-determining protein RodA [Oscillospiraceae bacterium]|nr:rod shape-determining protein RodA [Oscillospiraceae bacterium]